ncbi:MAG: DsbA family protein [Anaerolineae bacterium]
MSRRRRISTQQKKTKQAGITRMQIGLVVGLAIIMVVTFIVFNRGSGGGEPAATTSSGPPPAEQGMLAGIDLSAIPSEPAEDGSPALGAPEAPVTIVEYSDYQCPHCAHFSQDTLPEVIKNYVTAGKVRFVHKDMAILGEQSQWAAQAANCAADQGHFWEYHELLFQKQSGRNEGAFSRDNLKQFAADLELDTATFNQCLDQNKYSQRVIDETAEGKQRGVEGTPSFFVNDEFVVGNVPFSQMKDLIEKHLEGAS